MKYSSRRVFNLTSSTKGHSSTTSTEFQNASNINVSSTRKRQSLLCFCPDAKKMDDDEIHEHTGTQAGLRRPLPQRRKRHYRPSCMHETLKTAAGVAGNILGVLCADLSMLARFDFVFTLVSPSPILYSITQNGTTLLFLVSFPTLLGKSSSPRINQRTSRSWKALLCSEAPS